MESNQSADSGSRHLSQPGGLFCVGFGKTWYIRYSETVDIVGRALVRRTKWGAIVLESLLDYDERSKFCGEMTAEEQSVYNSWIVRPANFYLYKIATTRGLRAWAYKGWQHPTEADRSEVPATAWINNLLDLHGGISGLRPFDEDRCLLGEDCWMYRELIFDRKEIEQLCNELLEQSHAEPRWSLRDEQVEQPEPAQPLRRPSCDELVEWYKSRVANWQPGCKPPSEKEDYLACNQHFGEIPRKVTRYLRASHAPEAWRRAGRRSSKLTALGQSRQNI